MRADELSLRLDRAADVPLSVQLAWSLRARILQGELEAGEPLPALRDLAAEAGLTVNTVRSVYARLEQDGLVETRQGSGTFVSAEAGASRGIADLAARTARAAASAGVDPREVAVALYGASGGEAEDHARSQRERLRREIRTLENALAGLEAGFPELQPKTSPPRTERGARLLSVEELELVRDSLVERLDLAHSELVRRNPDRSDLRPQEGRIPAPRRARRPRPAAG